MTIRKYIDPDYLTVSLHEDIEDVKSKFIQNNFLVVLDDNSEYTGVITCHDLNPTVNKVSDCNYHKPFATPNQKMVDVVNLMKQTSLEVLPVEENGRFIGVIKSSDLVYSLAGEVKKYQLLFQHVTHDLRNPIGNLTGILKLLEESMNEPENLKIIGYGKESCRQVVDALNELLAIEKKENNKSGFEITELSQFILECIHQLKGTLSIKAITFKCNLSPIEYFAKINQNHIQRVLHNILANAVKFSAQDGLITISSQIINHKYLLEIKDNGIGIPFEIQAYAFDQFTRAQRTGTAGEQSIGLGLYFCKQTIEQHGGRIWFESEEGLGTTFFIELPPF